MTITISEEEFMNLILKEYEDWCGYNAESYFNENNPLDDDDLFEFVMCNVEIDNKRTTIEQLDDDEFEEWKAFFKKMNKDKFLDLIDEYLHPYDPWTEHRADWYGLR